MRQTSMTSSQISPFFHFHALLRLVVAVGVVLLFSCFSADAFVRRPNNGIMKLCPPGGQSFAAAWEITCGMRRKKRDAEESPEETKSTQEKVGTNANQNLEHGQEKKQKQTMDDNDNGEGTARRNRSSANVSLGQRRENDTPKTSMATDIEPKQAKTWWNSIGDMFFGRASTIGHGDGEYAMALEAEGLDDKQLYRPPSMTEMMLFCCRFGCSLRDLLPFCDPFGAWDS